MASNIGLLHASHAHMCMLLHLGIALVHTMCVDWQPRDPNFLKNKRW